LSLKTAFNSCLWCASSRQNPGQLATGLPTNSYPRIGLYTARHGYFLLFLYFLFNVYVVLDAIPATNVPGPSGI
jgi:hypothetical protein